MDEEIFQENLEEVVPTSDNVEPSPEMEIDLQPIIDSLENIERVQIEFFNNISIVLLLIPIVIITGFAVKEFMDRVTRW
jgi:hypothetical protein